MATIVNDRDVLLQATSPRNLSQDNILTPSQKPEAVQEYNAIIGEQAGFDSQASACGVSSTAYDAAITALTTYLGTLTGWNTIPGTNVAIVGTTFRQKFTDVYAAKSTLLYNIAQNVGTAQIVPNAATEVANITATSISLTNQNTASSEPNNYLMFNTILSYNYTAPVDCSLVATVVSNSSGSGTSGGSLAGGPSYIYRDRIDIAETFSTANNMHSAPEVSGVTPLSSFVTRQAYQSSYRIFSLSAGQSVTIRYRISSNDFSFMTWMMNSASLRLEVIKR